MNDNKTPSFATGCNDRFDPRSRPGILADRGAQRAALAGGGVILLFVLGILIAGIRVISFPGYEDGYRKYVEVQGRDPKYPRL